MILGIVANNWGNDLALPKGRPVVDGGDTDLVIGILDDDREKAIPFSDHGRHLLNDVHVLTAQGQRVDASVREDDELHEVDRIGTFAKDAALRSTLSAVLQETFHILEVAYAVIGCESLGRVEQITVTGEDIANLSLRNGHQRGGMDYILNGHQVV